MGVFLCLLISTQQTIVKENHSEMTQATNMMFSYVFFLPFFFFLINNFVMLAFFFLTL